MYQLYIIYNKELDAFGNTHTQAKNDYWIDAFCDSLSATATGATISVGLGEASSYISTGKPMTANQAVVSGILGASTGVAYGGIGITGEQTLSQALGATVYNVGRYAVAPMAVFSGGTAFAVGWLDPSVWSASDLGSNSGNTASTGKSQQSGQSKTNSSNPLNTNYFNSNYLSYVGKSALSGAEFGAEFGGAMMGIGTLAGGHIHTPLLYFIIDLYTFP